MQVVHSIPTEMNHESQPQKFIEFHPESSDYVRDDAMTLL
jgi:hypothetical protein